MYPESLFLQTGNITLLLCPGGRACFGNFFQTTYLFEIYLFTFTVYITMFSTTQGQIFPRTLIIIKSAFIKGAHFFDHLTFLTMRGIINIK
jgi:hypothetical protein